MKLTENFEAVQLEPEEELEQSSDVVQKDIPDDFNHKKYRDNLAKNLKKMRTAVPEGLEYDPDLYESHKAAIKKNADERLKIKKESDEYKIAREMHLDENKTINEEILIDEDVFSWTIKGKKPPTNEGTVDSGSGVFEIRTNWYKEALGDFIKTFRMPEMVAFVGKDYVVFSTDNYGHAVYLLPLKPDDHVDPQSLDKEGFLSLIKKYATNGNGKLDIRSVRSHGASNTNHPEHDIESEDSMDEEMKSGKFLEILSRRFSGLFKKSVERRRAVNKVVAGVGGLGNKWSNEEVQALKSLASDEGVTKGLDILNNPLFKEAIENNGVVNGKYIGDPGEFIDSVLIDLSKVSDEKDITIKTPELTQENIKEVFSIENRISGIIYDVSRNTSISNTHIDFLKTLKTESFSVAAKDALEKKLIELKNKLEGKRRGGIAITRINELLKELTQR